jgi:hypothetical protein
VGKESFIAVASSGTVGGSVGVTARVADGRGRARCAIGVTSAKFELDIGETVGGFSDSLVRVLDIETEVSGVMLSHKSLSFPESVRDLILDTISLVNNDLCPRGDFFIVSNNSDLISNLPILNQVNLGGDFSGKVSGQVFKGFGDSRSASKDFESSEHLDVGVSGSDEFRVFRGDVSVVLNSPAALDRVDTSLKLLLINVGDGMRSPFIAVLGKGLASEINGGFLNSNETLIALAFSSRESSGICNTSILLTLVAVETLPASLRTHEDRDSDVRHSPIFILDIVNIRLESEFKVKNRISVLEIEDLKEVDEVEISNGGVRIIFRVSRNHGVFLLISDDEVDSRIWY